MRRKISELCLNINTSYSFLTPWSRVLLQKVTGSQLVKKFPHFNEPEGSLPLSQMPATCPCPRPDRSNPYPTSHFLKIHLNIIPSTSGSSKWSLSPMVSPPKTCICLSSPYMCYIHRPSHFLNYITRKIFGEQYRSLSSSLCSFLHPRVTSSLLCPNILLSTLYSNTISLHSSLNVSDLVSHPYKTDKIIVLYILIFKFLNTFISRIISNLYIKKVLNEHHTTSANNTTIGK
jgi:hypothetical protein